jgi:hypothetical protein
MERRLLLRRREGPGGVGAALLPEGEAELAGRLETVWAGGTERAARLVAVQRAQVVLTKKQSSHVTLRAAFGRCAFAIEFPPTNFAVQKLWPSKQVGRGRSRPADGALPQIPGSLEA